MITPNVGEIRRAKDILEKCHCKPNGYYRYTSCLGCGVFWWASFKHSQLDSLKQQNEELLKHIKLLEFQIKQLNPHLNDIGRE
jgi:nitrogen fixation-related uncharacterized protein